MAHSRRNFTFTLPPLPKAAYQFVQQVRQTFDVSQYTVVVAGLLALRERGQADPAAAEALVARAKAITAGAPFE